MNDLSVIDQVEIEGFVFNVEHCQERFVRVSTARGNVNGYQIIIQSLDFKGIDWSMSVDEAVIFVGWRTMYAIPKITEIIRSLK